jgi:MFS family permease
VRVVPRRGAALTPAQRGALTAAGAANALIFLDQTSVTVALPAIQRDFDSSTAEVQWTIGAYLLVLASLMAGSGRLADLYGRRRLFLAGVALFGVCSLACAIAASQLALIVARLAQGAGAALTQPLALAHATAVVPPERRGWAVGVLASAGTTCLMIGPLLGGLLVETVGWRWVFLMNLPVVALALILGRRHMVESPSARRPPARRIRGDRAAQRPSPPSAAAPPAPGGASSLAALLAIQGAVLGVTVYVVLFLQNGLGLSAIEAGAALLPAMMWSALLSTWTGRLADRHGERRLVGGGLVLAAAGLAAIGLLAPTEEVLWLLPGLLAFGIARPFVFTPASTGPLEAIPTDERGLASSLVTESRQLGAVLGVAALGALAAAFEDGGATGASASGLEAGMLVAAGAALAAGVAALALLPRASVAPRASPPAAGR